MCKCNYFQVLQREQEGEIARLEKEAHEMRAKHSEAVQKIKAKFIAEKCAFQKESDGKISELTREANLVRIYLRNLHKRIYFYKNPEAEILTEADTGREVRIW